MSFDGEQVVIVDLGSHSIKAGWAGEEVASLVFPTPSGAIERGFIQNFSDVEKIFRQVFQELKTEPSAYPVLVCVAPKTSNANKNKIASILFEVSTRHNFNVLFPQTSIRSFKFHPSSSLPPRTLRSVKPSSSKGSS